MNYDLTLRQVLPKKGDDEPQPLHVPVLVGLIGPDGKDMPLRIQGEYKDSAETTRMLELRAATQIGRLWIADGDKLDIRAVDIVWRFEETVCIDAGIEDIVAGDTQFHRNGRIRA